MGLVAQHPEHRGQVLIHDLQSAKSLVVVGLRRLNARRDRARRLGRRQCGQVLEGQWAYAMREQAHRNHSGGASVNHFVCSSEAPKVSPVAIWCSIPWIRTVTEPSPIEISLVKGASKSPSPKALPG